jgi:hypothetical protein
MRKAFVLVGQGWGLGREMGGFRAAWDCMGIGWWVIALWDGEAYGGHSTPLGTYLTYIGGIKVLR